MIYNELRDFVGKISSNETVDLFDDAIELFDKYSVPGYLEVFENTIGETNEIGADGILDYLLTNVRTIVSHLLSIQGVTIKEEASISYLITLANTLFDIPYYEDKVMLKTILSSDESREEIFCTLMSLLTVESVDEHMSYLSLLDEDFVKNFSEQIKIIETNLLAEEQISKHISLYKKFKTVILNDSPAYADKYFERSATLGLPFTDYLKHYIIDREMYLHDTTGNLINTIALELVGIAICSNEGVGAPLIVIRKHLNDIYSDINSITKVDLAVSKIVLQLTQ